MVRFVQSSLSFDHLNILLADIACVLEKHVGEAVRSTKSVTLYITVNITPLNLYNNNPSIPTEGDDPPAEEATTLREHFQFPPSEHHQPVETGNNIPQSQEEMSPTGTKNPLLALDRADEDMKRIVPIDESNMWKDAVKRIKWVMDTLGPLAEVRVVPFWCPSLS